ncbi:MAG: hypothetical protein COA42_10720 [Alteromonadaceae bacterium]|nr:MAG: hypothetical protein COA42_10720 [Alteromonadaceae bacterium]
MLLICLFGLGAYRFYILSADYMPVFFDEAYYYHWSEQLDFGYYSKPPMVAWLIALATKTIGVSSFSVKLMSPILYGATAWLVFEIARFLADQKTALLAALIFSSTPLVGFYSLFMTTDVPLYFFWALASFLFLHCRDSSDYKRWSLLGVVLGLGLLSKYTFIALNLGLVLYLFLSGRRHVFTQVPFWLAVLLCGLVASTNLYWNVVNDFVSFRHTQDIAKLSESLINPLALLTFWLSQIAVFGVFWLGVFVWHWRLIYESSLIRQHILFLSCIIVPLFLLVSVQALLSRAFANWAGPIVIGASILLAMACVKLKRKVVMTALVLQLFLLSIFNHWPQILQALDIEQHKKNSPYTRILGWRELSQQLHISLNIDSETQLLSDSRKLLAYLGFHARVPVTRLVYWNPVRENVHNQYDLKNNIADTYDPALRYLLVLQAPINAEIKQRFRRVSKEQKISYTYSAMIVRTVYIYQVNGFKGYANE